MVRLRFAPARDLDHGHPGRSNGRGCVKPDGNPHATQVAVQGRSDDAHTFERPSFGVHGSPPPGKTVSITITCTFTANRAGVFYFYGSRPGCAQGDMVGRLTVHGGKGSPLNRLPRWGPAVPHRPWALAVACLRSTPRAAAWPTHRERVGAQGSPSAPPRAEAVASSTRRNPTSAAAAAPPSRSMGSRRQRRGLGLQPTHLGHEAAGR